MTIDARRRRVKPPPAARPAFFFSYSRVPIPDDGDLSDPNAEQHQFFNDLKRAVNQLLPIPAGDPIGFLDVGQETGVKWSDELIRNLDNATVFVALLSARYVSLSEWCPMEWSYFARRKVTTKDGTRPQPNATAILPVNWSPVGGPLPAMIKAVQQFEPGTDAVLPRHRTLYLKEGVLGMQKFHEGQGAYNAVVWSLAREIQNRVNTLDVRPSGRRTADGLRRSFWPGA